MVLDNRFGLKKKKMATFCIRMTISFPSPAKFQLTFESIILDVVWASCALILTRTFVRRISNLTSANFGPGKFVPGFNVINKLCGRHRCIRESVFRRTLARFTIRLPVRIVFAARSPGEPAAPSLTCDAGKSAGSSGNYF